MLADVVYGKHIMMDFTKQISELSILEFVFYEHLPQ